jgi:hypothetical protein
MENKMIVKDLEQMETIVNANKTLFWDGWTVVNSYPSEKGRTLKSGALVNSKWHVQTRYEPNQDGWNIPSKFAG